MNVRRLSMQPLRGVNRAPAGLAPGGSGAALQNTHVGGLR